MILSLIPVRNWVIPPNAAPHRFQLWSFSYYYAFGKVISRNSTGFASFSWSIPALHHVEIWLIVLGVLPG